MRLTCNVMVGLRQTVFASCFGQASHWLHFSWPVFPRQLLNMHETKQERHAMPSSNLSGNPSNANTAIGECPCIRVHE